MSWPGRRSVSHKHCTRCKRWLPADAFPANRKLLSGLSSWCRDCHRAATRRWRAENPEAVEAEKARQRVTTPPLSKVCVECGVAFATRQPAAVICGARACRTAREVKRQRAKRERS